LLGFRTIYNNKNNNNNNNKNNNNNNNNNNDNYILYRSGNYLFPLRYEILVT